MKEPNPKDFDLTENLINWYPNTYGRKIYLIGINFQGCLVDIHNLILVLK